MRSNTALVARAICRLPHTVYPGPIRLAKIGKSLPSEREKRDKSIQQIASYQGVRAVDHELENQIDFSTIEG
jgi:hypothetical protein